MKLVLVRGLPGSGKSTHASALLSSGVVHAHFEADMFHMDGGVYKFDGARIKDAHEWCQTNTRVFLNNRKSVVVSNTFTTLDEMQFYVTLASDVGADLQIRRCTGHFGSVHNVPAEVLERMRNRFQTCPGELFVDSLRPGG